MAVTLADIAKVEKSPFAKAVIMDLLRKSDLMSLVSIENVPGLRVTGRRWQTLPTVATRKVNADYSDSTGTTEETQESLFIYGGQAKIDSILQKAAGSLTEAPVVTQTKMLTEALAYKFNYDFINGDHTVDPDGFEGLKVRVANGSSRMKVSLASSGDTLKVLASTANEHAFLDGLHEAIHKVGATALLMNENTYIKVGAVLRRVGLMNYGQDNFGRTFQKFGDVRLVDVGVKGDQSTEIITSTETAGDGGADDTSIYAVRFGGDDGLRMLQLEGTSMKAETIGPDQDHAASVVRIDWCIGLENVGRYAVARLNGFKMAAS